MIVPLFPFVLFVWFVVQSLFLDCRAAETGL